MKTATTTSILLLAAISMSFGNPLQATFEGDEKKRERLARLQDSQTPPVLQVVGWLNSDALTLEDLKGKVVVLDFWATWCGPCIGSIPHTNELQKKYKDDVVIIAVCHPKGAEKMESVANDKGIRYATVKDEDGKTAQAYQVNGFPDYYIIDRKGVLRVADCANAKVEEAIQLLLAE
jgi:thiol-disulfide isomerase/thioredoxin